MCYVFHVMSYAINKKAKFDYDILEVYEAGLVLLGHEVKSIRQGHISLKGAFVTIKNTAKKLPELYLINAHVSLYKQAGKIDNYNPERSRKLLLKKSEIKRLIGKKQEQGLTLVPLELYNKKGFIKLKFGLAKGKKKIDKRELIKKRELDRKLKLRIKNEE